MSDPLAPDPELCSFDFVLIMSLREDSRVLQSLDMPKLFKSFIPRVAPGGPFVVAS